MRKEVVDQLEQIVSTAGGTLPSVTNTNIPLYTLDLLSALNTAILDGEDNTVQPDFWIGSSQSGGLRRLRFQSSQGITDISATPNGNNSIVVPDFSGTFLVRSPGGTIQFPSIALPTTDGTIGGILSLADGGNNNPSPNGNSTWNLSTNGTNFRLLHVDSSGAIVLPFSISGAGLSTFTGGITINPSSSNLNAVSSFGGNAGYSSIIAFLVGGLYRWSFGRDSSPEGVDNGSNFGVYRYNNAGTYLDAPLSITRINGRTTVTGFGFRSNGFSSFIDQELLTANRFQTIPNQAGAFVLREDLTAFTGGDLLIGRSSGVLARAKLSSQGSVAITNGDGTVTLDTANAQVTEFTASGTYNVPVGSKVLILEAFGGGGGGGGGCRRATGIARPGGAGGNGGAYTSRSVRVSDLPSQLSVTIGLGGGGGLSASTNDGNGASGSAGGDTSIQDGVGFVLVAYGGSGGPGSAGTAATAVADSNLRGNPGGLGGSSTAAAATTPASPTVFGGGGGGAGGGVNASNARTNGAIGSRGFAMRDASNGSPGLGGTSASLNGENATSTSHHGGGGASGENSGAGGNGGNGSRGGGGGGAGGMTNGSAATSTGGRGGDGFVRITAIF